jgi:hypothetical protein
MTHQTRELESVLVVLSRISRISDNNDSGTKSKSSSQINNVLRRSVVHL